MLKSNRMVAACLLMLCLLGNPTAGVQAQSDQRCFAGTGNCISGRLRQYWEQNGGLSVFGLPLTQQYAEVIEGRSYQVQWFERNRLELHPENAAPNDVLLGRLGADRLRQLGQNYPPSQPRNGCRYFTTTSHNLCGEFLSRWLADGEGVGLTRYGLPLGDEVRLTLAGREYTAQWFERARFEFHPENQPPNRVLLGLLGAELRGQTVAAPPPLGNACQPNARERRIGELMTRDPGQKRARLTCNPILERVARERAADLAKRGYFDHVNPDGFGPNYLVRQAGYPLPGFYPTALAANNIESISGGYDTAEETWRRWLTSPGHRTHLLGEHPFYADQVEYGVGYYYDAASPMRHYWVVLSAYPEPL